MLLPESFLDDLREIAFAQNSVPKFLDVGLRGIKGHFGNAGLTIEVNFLHAVLGEQRFFYRVLAIPARHALDLDAARFNRATGRRSVKLKEVGKHNSQWNVRTSRLRKQMAPATWPRARVRYTRGMKLDAVQRAAQEQFARQSHRYGKGHVLENIEDVEKAIETMALPKQARVLDVATGRGHTGLYLASLGYDVTLADIALPMLEQAARTAAERGLSVKTSQHAAEVFPHAAGEFDLVSCRVAAHHFSSPADFVRESTRVLKPGGHFLLIDGSVEDDQAVAEAWAHEVEKLRDPSHNRLLTPGQWTKLCEAAGLKVSLVELSPFKQPDLNWYFEAAATSPENRTKVLGLVAHAPESARKLFSLGEEDGKIVWWWQRLTLVARKG